MRLLSWEQSLRSFPPLLWSAMGDEEAGGKPRLVSFRDIGILSVRYGCACSCCLSLPSKGERCREIN
jgi:hypothetical protein